MVRDGDVRCFQNANDLMAHYKAIQARLNPPPKKPVRVAVTPKVIAPPKPKPKITKPMTVAQEEPTPTNMHDFLEAVRDRKILASWANVKRLATFMEEHYGLQPGDLLGQTRKAKVVKVRQELYYYLMKVFRFSLSKAGKSIQRDHTTILHGVRQWEKKLDDLLGV